MIKISVSQIGLESWYTQEMGQWICIDELGSWTQMALWDLVDRYGEKDHCQINRGILETRRNINLLKQWNHIWYSSCNWNRHLVCLMTIHCHSPRSVCLLHGLNKPHTTSWMGMRWESPPLRLSGTNLCSVSRNAVLLPTPVFLVESVLMASTWSFPPY